MGRPGFFTCAEARWSNGAPVTRGGLRLFLAAQVDPETAAEYAQAIGADGQCLAISARQSSPDTELGVERDRCAHAARAAECADPVSARAAAESYTYPVYRPAVERYGEDWVRPEHMVSNGAFTLREHMIGGRIALAEESALLGRGPRALAGGRVLLPLDRAVQAARFFAGELMFTDPFSAEQTAWLRSQAGRPGGRAPCLGNFMLGLNAATAAVSGNRGAAHGADARRGSRNPGALCASRTCMCRPGHADAAAARLPAAASGLGAPVRGRASRAGAALLRRRPATRATHPLRIDLHYPTGTDERRTYRGGGGHVARQPRRRGGNLQRRIQGAAQ